MEMREDRFSQNLTLSVLVHLGVVAIFSIKSIFFPGEPIVFQEALRVDIIALPQKVQAPAPRPKPAPKRVEVTAKPKPPTPRPQPRAKKTDLKKVKADQLDALRRLEMQSALDKLKKIPEPQPIATPKKIEYRGNIISPGTSLTGVQQLQQEQYFSQVKQHISKNWFLPEWLAKSPLQAKILVKIDKNGSILSYEIEKSSGNSEFDELVLNTVKQSHPLPKPPEKFTDIVAVNGVVLGFPE